MKAKWLTVRELIAQLEQQDEAALVITEGCDCYGEVGGVEIERHFIDADGKYVPGGFQVVCIQRRGAA